MVPSAARERNPVADWRPEPGRASVDLVAGHRQLEPGPRLYARGGQRGGRVVIGTPVGCLEIAGGGAAEQREAVSYRLLFDPTIDQTLQEAAP